VKHLARKKQVGEGEEGRGEGKGGEGEEGRGGRRGKGEEKEKDN
jgi:hypothetical protein